MTKGADKTLTFQAVNNHGGILDLTSFTSITFQIKDGDTVKVQKRSEDAGGNESEIKIINASYGLFAVYIDRTDTVSLDAGIYKMGWYATDGSKDCQKTYPLRVEEGLINSTEATMIYSKKYEAQIDFDVTETVTEESGWTGTIMPSNEETGIYHITSSASEFTNGSTFIFVDTGSDVIQVIDHYSTSVIKVKLYNEENLTNHRFIIQIKVI